MRNKTNPSIEQMKDLYEAAAAFKQAQPWTELYDADLIAVDNPETGERGYCSVMGHGGMHYALGVYLGTKGLFGFNRLLEKSGDMTGLAFLEFQDNIMCSFEDRDQLNQADRDQIKALGLKFRGRNAWPMFRRYEPGFYPWSINVDECMFLTHALRQVLIVVSDLREGKLQMDPDINKMILRQARKQGEQLLWESQLIERIHPTRTFQPVQIDDEELLDKIKTTPVLDTILLADVLYAPEPVQDKKDDRPYFPRLVLFLEKQTGLAVSYEIYEDIKQDADVVLHELIDFILAQGRPKEIHVRGERMPVILTDVCSKAGIGLRVVKQLKQIDKLVKDLTSFL